MSVWSGTRSDLRPRRAVRSTPPRPSSAGSSHCQRRGQRGAALLTAMVIVTLVATLAAGMVWQQWRAVQVEAAERARAQAQWILSGAMDWARLILREDARQNQRRPVDDLGEPWAVPLAEAKLSTFLAADRDNTEGAPEAFLSGSITDAQSRYNLRNYIQAGANLKAEERVLQRLVELAGVRSEVAPLLMRGLRDLASPASPGTAGAGGADATTAASANPNPPLMPQRLDQLAWLGVDAQAVKQLAPYVMLLPQQTNVNVNTAPKEVLAAVIEGLDLASAERLVQTRQRTPFRTVNDLQPWLPSTVDPSTFARGLTVASDFFVVQGRLRLLDRVIEERTLLQRNGLNIIPLRRERLAGFDGGAVAP